MALLLALAAGRSAHAQKAPQPPSETSPDREAATQAENPLARVLSLKVFNRTSYLIGPHERTSNQLVFQPGFPVSLPAGLSLLTQLKLPLVWAPDTSRPTGTTFGMGDLELSTVLSPRPWKGILYVGAGPTVTVPSGTDAGLGSSATRKLSVGPIGELTVTPGPLVIGLVVTHLWSVAGAQSGIAVNRLEVQYLLDVNFGRGWYLTSTPTAVADWTARSGQRWTVPVGGGLGRTRVVNASRKLALGFEMQAFWNAVRPEQAAPWALRLQVQLLVYDPAPAAPQSQ